MGTGSYRQSEISVNIRNCSIVVGTYFMTEAPIMDSPLIFQRQYLLPGLVGQRNRCPQREAQISVQSLRLMFSNISINLKLIINQFCN